MLISGQMVGRFKVLGKLGQGGMGSIYRGVDTIYGGIEVAIKEVEKAIVHHNEGLSTFRSEVSLAMQLNHQNIVAFVDAVEMGGDKNHPDNLYLVTRLVKGKTLQDLIDERALAHNLFSQDQAVSVIKTLLSALGYAHQKGVIHRDIKGSNVMIEDGTGIPIVIDFGIAKGTLGAPNGRTAFLASGARSPYYSSPEQESGDATSPASDIYSVGVLLYEMLTNNVRTVFKEQSIVRILQPPDYLTHLPFVSPEMEKIILKAVSPFALNRYQSADEMITALNGLIGGFGPSNPTVPVLPSSGSGMQTTRRTVLDIRK